MNGAKIAIEPIVHLSDRPLEDARSAALRALRRLDPRIAGVGHYPDGAPMPMDEAGRELQGVYISISHSHRLAAAAISDRPVGIDIEQPRQQLTRVATRFLTPEQLAGLRMRLPMLAIGWTVKEAVFKLARTPGLSLTDISLDTESHLPDGRPYSISSVWLRGHALTVATVCRN